MCNVDNYNDYAEHILDFTEEEMERMAREYAANKNQPDIPCFYTKVQNSFANEEYKTKVLHYFHSNIHVLIGTEFSSRSSDQNGS